MIMAESVPPSCNKPIRPVDRHISSKLPRTVGRIPSPNQDIVGSLACLVGQANTADDETYLKEVAWLCGPIERIEFEFHLLNKNAHHAGVLIGQVVTIFGKINPSL